MKKNFYWGFMLMLSNHMWSDETTKPSGWYGHRRPYVYSENNNTDIAVWDEVVAHMAKNKLNMMLIDVGDGIKYESHPEISAPDAWDKDFLKKKLDEMRAVGITPIPKLNFSCAHDTWLKKYRRLISTPEYYSACSDLIKEVAELFGSPELFHLGFDEETAPDQVNYEMATVRGEKLWWHDLNFFAKECEKAGSRPWIWSDYIWGHRDLFLERMSHEIVQSNWYYGRFRDNPDYYPKEPLWLETYELLDKHGFEQIPTGASWRDVRNVEHTVAHCKYKLSEDLVLGVLAAPWLRTDRYAACGLRCDIERMYYGRKTYYPETL